MNHVVLMGRLTKDAEVKVLNSGQNICKLNIAFDTSKKDEYGNWTKIFRSYFSDLKEFFL